MLATAATMIARRAARFYLMTNLPERVNSVVFGNACERRRSSLQSELSLRPSLPARHTSHT